MTLLEITEPEKLKVASVTANDIYDSISTIKPSTNLEELGEFNKFTLDYGESDSMIIDNQEPTHNTSQQFNKRRKQTKPSSSSEIGSLEAVVRHR